MITCIHTKHISTFCNSIVCNYKTADVVRIKNIFLFISLRILQFDLAILHFDLAFGLLEKSINQNLRY